MKYKVELDSNNQLPLPDDFCQELNFAVGDILLCEKLDNTTAISLHKHVDQTLTDAEIASAGNLTRVIPLVTQDVCIE
ncbi:hypothetical protein [Rheinheimera sp. MM224]|uniref:hypothetical protein n=1 Tax=Rheinheimera sp. MM224 TaxID=3019969 RepID=UPI001DCDDFBC|nr:hypothetical protein [Rheinheimera sp. MM224]MBY0417676.1 hypothetical protein [Rheinheimera sp.]CAI3798064.1 hypothetical protein JAMGFMIE_01978 [Rheinheimera sp. MM224]